MYTQKKHQAFKQEKYIQLVALVFLLLGFTSCQKEIDLNLNGVESKYVVEAIVTNQDGGSKVLLSRTKDFSEDNSRLTVSGANITIKHGDSIFVFEETDAGTYERSGFKGQEGQSYELRVEVEEEVFTALSTMPALVNMDSLYISEEFVFDKTYKLPTIDFIDPALPGNNYRFLVYVNNIKKKQIFVYNDEFSNGRANATRLYVSVGEDEDHPDNQPIVSGDVVSVEMLNIDLPVYKYFFSLENSATGESQSATPANPVTNIKGGALGYFSAHTFQQKEVRVP